MMRFYYLSLLVLLVSCSRASSSSGGTDQVSGFTKAVYDTADFSRTVLGTDIFKSPKPGFEIGNLYNVSLSDHSGLALLLSDIEISQEETLYYFMYTPHVFPAEPSLQQLLQYGLAGNKIATAENGAQAYVPGYDQLEIDQKDLDKIKASFRPFAFLPLGMNTRIGGGGSFTRLEDLEQHVVSFKHGVDAPREHNPFIDVQFCLVAFDYIDLAQTESQQKKPRYVWLFNRNAADTRAQKLLTDSFYYDEMDDFTPFGNDDGNDILYNFYNWRREHQSAPVSDFLRQALAGQSIQFNPDEANIERLPYQSIMYPSVERTITGLCFAQIMIEGRLDKQMKQWGILSLNRQATDVFVNMHIPANQKQQWLAAIKLKRAGLMKF